MLRRLAHCAQTCVIVCSITIGVHAQTSPTTPIFERVDGLSHNTVLSILQDRQGFLWIGTLDGLNRYDGYEFVVYRHDPDDSTSPSGNTIRALLEDSDGWLWIGTDGGLSRLDRRSGQFIRHDLPGASSPDIAAIDEAPDGRLWVSTYGSEIYRSDAARRQFESHRPTDIDTTGVLALLPQQGGTSIWLARPLEDARIVLHPTVSDGRDRRPLGASLGQAIYLPGSYRYAPGVRIPPIDASRWDTVWVAAPPPDPNAPLFESDATAPADPAPRIAFIPGLPPGMLMNDIMTSGDGNVWIAGEEAVYRLNPKSGQLAAHRTDTSATAWLTRNVQILYEDRASAIWAGTLGGLFRYDPHRKPFVHLGPRSPKHKATAGPPIAALAEDGEGGFWVGTIGGGLLHLDSSGHRTETYRHQPDDPTSLPSDNIWAIHRDGNRLWLATQPVCAFDLRARRCTRYPVRSLAFAEDMMGDLWFGRADTLYRMVKRTGRFSQHVLPIRNIQTLYTDPTGSDTRAIGSDTGETHANVLWIGTDRGQLARLDVESGDLATYPTSATKTNGPFPESIWAIHRDERGGIWLGTTTGLFRFDPQSGRFRLRLDPVALPGSIIYSILEDDRGRLWMGTNQGLVRFDPNTDEVRHYDRSDGIESVEFNRRAALRGSDGTFYFGGLNGITSFDPEAVRDNPFVPPVVVIRAEVASRDTSRTVRFTGADSLILDYTDYSLAFEFAALNFAKGHKNRYAYQMTGFDSKWIEAGTRRFARYTNLPPGEYVFRVRGSNDDNLWNEKGASIAVIVAPPFWQTWWFRLLMIGTVVGLLWTAYRARVRHLLALERLRVRIAGDLHDDIGSKLGSVVLMSEMIRERRAFGEKEDAQLARISVIARQTAEILRDIVWFVDPDHDGPDALLWKMRNEAATILNGIDYRFEHSEPEQLSVLAGLDVKQRRDLFLIYKEALHNVVRHAGAEEVRIGLHRKGTRLELVVADDGRGFPASVDNVSELEASSLLKSNTGEFNSIEPNINGDGSEEFRSDGSRSPATWPGSNGHGLTSMRRRADEIGGRLEILSRAEEGTRLRLVLNLP